MSNNIPVFRDYKPRLTEVTDEGEQQELCGNEGCIGYPHVLFVRGKYWADADELRKWRAFQAISGADDASR